MMPAPRQRFTPLLPWLLSALLLALLACAPAKPAAGPDSAQPESLPAASTLRAGDVILAWRDLPAPPKHNAARPLLLVTGFAMSAEGWNREFVRGLNSGRRVILMDNRGMGAAADLPAGAPVDMPAMAADAARLLDVLGIAKADVLGWSMGGGIALELALARPERVGALVLYAPPLSGARVKPMLDRMFAMSPVELKEALFPRQWAAAHPEVWAAMPPPAAIPEGMAARQYAALCSWPGVAARLPGLRVPALFLVGGDDWVCPPLDGRAQAAAVPGARFELVPQGGHWMMHQNPRELARLVDAFLRRAPLDPRPGSARD